MFEKNSPENDDREEDREVISEREMSIHESDDELEDDEEETWWSTGGERTGE